MANDNQITIKDNDNNPITIQDIEKVAQVIEGTIKSTSITKRIKPGDNFVCLVLDVEFHLETNGKSRPVSAVYHAVAKRLPSAGQPRKEIAALGMQNEIRWYKEILPLLKEFATENGIPTDYYADYVGSRLSLDPRKIVADEEAVLLLKNLNSDGYHTKDRTVGLDLPTAKEALRMLASFHLVPLAMQFKKPQTFNIIKQFLESSQLYRPPPPNGQSNTRLAGTSGKSAYDLIKEQIPPIKLFIDKVLELPECEAYKTKLEALKDNRTYPMIHKLAPKPWNTILHGDFWVNNILVEAEPRDKPRVKMVDFQFPGFASFGLDVVFFLLTSIQNEVQMQHFDELLKFYYDELTNNISRLDIPELVLSYEEYLDELKGCAKAMGIEHLIFYSCFLFGPKGGSDDVLLGKISMVNHLENVLENMTLEHKKKLSLIIGLAEQKGWF